MFNRTKLGFKNIFWLIGLLIILIILIVGYLNFYTIYDDILLANYKPPAAIAKLAQQDNMTNYAKTIFYINYPKLININRFYIYCPNRDPSQSIVLGCYHGNEGGIYLLNVSDPTLYGLEQVTAAHEMLHGIYSRLSTKVRNQLDAELMYFYEHDLKNPIVKAQIAIYRKTEPGYVENEMNSTFATECKNLTPVLNNFYKQFFTNRLAVVDFNNSYQSQLTNRENIVQKDDKQLSQLSTQINNLAKTLLNQKNQLTNLDQQINQLKINGPYNAYQSDVNEYNSLVNNFNNEVNNQYKPLINSYNQLVVKRNNVSDQLFKLQSTLINPYAPSSPN